MAEKTLRFRSYYDPGKYVDPIPVGFDEVVVDASCYEPTDVLVARLTRGEIVPGRFNPEYEFDSEMDPEQVFASMDPTKTPGFDLADVAEADVSMRQLKKAQRAEAVRQATEAKRMAAQPKPPKQVDIEDVTK